VFGSINNCGLPNEERVLNTETWRRIDDSVADALELPAEQQRAFLTLRLGDDEAALAEALSLVGEAEEADKLFSKGPASGLSGLTAGSRLGPWELLKPLGMGGMGVVWLARRVDGQAAMLAAIKLLPPALSGPLRGDRALLQSFLMEKQILARLQHPNIARLLDASAGAGESPNFVMEYVEGVPLMQYLEQSSANRLALFLKICAAVEYAHANLIIHRDLKPQNILVEKSGEPKLLDFGIARILTNPEGDSSLTLRRAFSLDYASPEQIRGGLISTASDIYSLGLILFEMMTGERARRWHDKALGEVLSETERFELPAQPGLSPDLLAVLRKATAAEVSRRYRSVSEFAGDVSRLMDGMPVQARPAGVLYQLSCFARRNVITVAASAMALLLICALAAWGFLSAGQAKSERAIAVEKSRQLQVALDAEQAARLAGEQQKKKAEQQEQLARHLGRLASDGQARAEARVRDLLRVFESIIVSARWDVSKLPGGTTAGIKMLEKTLTQLELLEPTPAAKANFLLLRAEAHSQVAELYGGSNSNIGNKDGASQHREKAIELWKELHGLDPNNANWDRALLEARFENNRRGLGLIRSEDAGPWSIWTKEHEALYRRAPKNRLVARALAKFYFLRGAATIATQPGRRNDLENSLRLFQQGVEDLNTDRYILRDMALAHKYLANVTGMEVDLRMQHAKEAVRLDRLRSIQDPSDTGAQMDLAFSLNAVADVQRLQKDYPAAQAGYLDSFLIRKALALSDPNNAQVLRSLLYPIRSHGLMSARLNDWNALKGAVKDFEWAAETSRPKADALDLATLNYWKSLLAREANDQPGTCRYGREALRLLKSQPGKVWLENPQVLSALLQACPDQLN
jgi:hypothetical protein